MLHRNRLRIYLLAFALCGMAVVAFPLVQAATLTVVNNDGLGEGFNDSTPVAPVGGNTGTTVGAQRLIAFQHAADIWGGLLSSSVTIRVGAQFDPLACDATSGVLGSAGPTNFFRDFAGAPVIGTWYPVALANALNGLDLEAGGDDIDATFNSNIGTSGCLESSGWYYGLDSAPPGGKIDFVSVLVHELGHGLGFLTLVNLATGAKPGGFDDTYMRNLERHGAIPSDYPSMTDAQRAAASKDTGNLHWVGANVKAASGTLTAGAVGDHVRMYAPNPQQPGSSVSHWDTVLSPNQIMEPSYTVALHNPALELPLFQDIGWTVLATAGTTLTVSKSGTGSGTVTSAPAGIDCGATCSFSFASGTSVTLTAASGTGSTFAGWSGACTGTGTCIVTMNSVKSVTATFELPDDGFPSGGIPAGWIQPSGSNASWVITNDSAYAGSLSLKSGAILDGQTSGLSYTATFAAGSVSFARRVSSEAEWDFLEFYIDGVLQSRWSGEAGWSVVSFPLAAGTHTLLWRYVKDPGCCIGGSDAAWIDSVTLPAGPPAAPVMGTATAGAGQVSVSFTPGSLNGGTLTDHHVTCTAASGPAYNGYGSNSPIVVTGLTGGVAYRCWARTLTNLGTSPWSGASNWATPTATTGPPAAPVMGTATAGAGQVSVSFTPGSLNGGTLTNHHVTCTATSGAAYNGYGAGSPIIVTGLTNGVAYRCWVRTVTNLGTSPWSGASNWATPTSGGVPAAPVMGTATAGAGQVSVSFTPGNLNGGTLTHHHVTCAATSGPAYNGYGPSSPIVVTGLTNGVAYHCWARTVTNLGTSPWSGASNWATPTSGGVPAAPVMGTATAGAGQVSVSFTPGSLNGGTLTHHQVTCTATSGPAYNGYGTSSPVVVSGLTGGIAYRCWARTVTNLGTSPWSGASNWATPTT